MNKEVVSREIGDKNSFLFDEIIVSWSLKLRQAIVTDVFYNSNLSFNNFNLIWFKIFTKFL